jgi:putative endopeptidase
MPVRHGGKWWKTEIRYKAAAITGRPGGGASSRRGTEAGRPISASCARAARSSDTKRVRIQTKHHRLMSKADPPSRLSPRRRTSMDTARTSAFAPQHDKGVRMRTSIYAACALLVLAASTAAGQERRPSYVPPERYGTHGLDLAAMDLTAKPGDDFYRYAVGKWVAGTVIPSDHIALSSSFDAQLRTAAQLRSIVRSSSPSRGRTTSKLIGRLYASFMDTTRLESLDDGPLQADLALIRNAPSRDSLAYLMGRPLRTFGIGFFRAPIFADRNDATRTIVWLATSGLSLESRDVYLEESSRPKVKAYEEYAARTLAMVGWDDAPRLAREIVELETAIARATWSNADMRDVLKTTNPMTVEEVESLAPGFPWRAFLAGAEVAPRIVNVKEKSSFPLIASIYANTPLETLKAWQALQLVDAMAPYLSSRFVTNQFRFRGTVLQGREINSQRSDRGVDLVNDLLENALGHEYVRRHFTPAAKQQVEEMAQNIKAAAARRIEGLPWMSAPTKAAALKKLARLNVMVGGPDHWTDYEGLRIASDDLYGNVRRAKLFAWKGERAQLERKSVRSDWQMSPQTPDAYSDASRINIVFPAAVLQPPFFDSRADAAVNYGALGSVIGHEIVHLFDDQGRRRDAMGNLRDWWTPEDAMRFEAEAARLGAQFDAFEALPGLHVNGKLTMGENIADLGGALVALDAYHTSLHGRAAPVIDGFSGDQRFFLARAQAYRGVGLPDYLRNEALANPHAPKPFRVNGPYRNMDAWYDAFNVNPRDTLYLPPESRVRLW